MQGLQVALIQAGNATIDGGEINLVDANKIGLPPIRALNLAQSNGLLSVDGAENFIRGDTFNRTDVPRQLQVAIVLGYLGVGGPRNWNAFASSMFSSACPPNAEPATADESNNIPSNMERIPKTMSSLAPFVRQVERVPGELLNS